MDVLGKNKGEDLAIFRAFAERTLKSHATQLKKTQDNAMKGFREDFWRQRTYVSSDISLKYTHNMINRFVDMKRRTVRGRKIRNNNHAVVHNKFIMGHFNGIKGDLTYGLTEDVKNKMREKIAEARIII